MQLNKSAFLGKDALFPLLMKMSIPAMIGMMVAALYNVADTIFVGRGAGAMAIAGLSVAFPIQMIVHALAQMIGIGAASIISRRLGERNPEGASSALGTAITFIAGSAILMTAGVAAFSIPLLKLFGASETVLPFASEYLQTVLWGFPFIAFSMAGNNLIRAEGNAKTAMNTMLIGMVLNIILDPLFIFPLGMGIKGAALATVISQGCSFIWIALYYLGGKSAVRIHGRNLRIKLDQLKEMTVLGIPNFVQSAGMSLLAVIINNTLLVLSGDLAISTYGITMRLLSFVFMPIIGLSQGFQPIAGYNYGARNFNRLKKVLLLTVVAGVAIASVFYTVIMLFPDVLIGLFTTDEELIASSVSALRTMSLVMPIISLQIISAIYFQAIGKGLHALLLGLSRQFLVLIPLVLILPRFFGVPGVWASFPAADFLSTVLSVTALLFELKHLNSRHRESLRIC